MNLSKINNMIINVFSDIQLTQNDEDVFKKKYILCPCTLELQLTKTNRLYSSI